MKMRAMILFAHGARAAAWAEPFRQLQQITQAALPDVMVSLAFLELMQPNLPELVSDLVEVGYDQISVVPVFLGQGGHVLRDLPLMVERIRNKYPELDLRIAAAAGEAPEVLKAISQYCIQTLVVSQTAPILKD